MFDFIKKIVDSGSGKRTAAGPDDINADLALTVLMLEAAYADGEFSQEEKEHLVSTLVTNFKIARPDIDALLAESKKEYDESVDVFRFTRYINDNFSKKQKLDLMESVWRIILLDGHLEEHEDHFAHKLASLLRLTHKELIDAKLQARQQLL